MKKVFYYKVLLLVAVALVGVAIATSCKKDKEEHEQTSAVGYFVQLNEPGGVTEIQKMITAYLYKDSLCQSFPYTIVGEFGCNLPDGYEKGDTIYAETLLEKLYPIDDGEINFGVGPYYKLLSIKQINR